MKVIHNLSAYARKPALVPVQAISTQQTNDCIVTLSRECLHDYEKLRRRPRFTDQPKALNSVCTIVCVRMHQETWFLPERDYFTFGSLLSQIRLSVVCNVRAPYSQTAEPFDDISSPLSTLAIL